MSRFLSLLAAMLSVFVFVSASAQQRALSDEQKATLQERLKAADTDNDGLIDRAEAQAKLPRLAKRFDTLDADGNGKLSPDELRAAGQKMAERRSR